MKRLFIRVWWSVFLLLVLEGALISLYLAKGWTLLLGDYLDPWTFGGYHYAAAQVESGKVEPEDLEPWFGCPVRVVDASKAPPDDELDWKNGGILLWHDDVGEYVAISIHENTAMLLLGPGPLYPEEKELALLAALTLGIALLATMVFRLLFRSVERELGRLEVAAGGIADGDWATRVDERQVRTATTLARAFNRMAAQTTAVIGAQRELLRAVSHELRTPISRLQLGVHILAAQDDRERRQARLEEVDRDITELDELVDELLTYARLEGQANMVQVDAQTAPWEEVERMVAQRSGEAAGRGIVLEIGPFPNDVTLSVEPRLFRRAVGNILSNGLRYARTRIEVSARPEKKRLVITVDDDGFGVPPEDRQRVFEPFVRLEESQSGPPSGHGMGLAIVRRILERYGGDVWLEESPSGGCRVVLRWPIEDGGYIL